ncbi:Acetyl esterase/lipase [Burkholderiales bacterium 8X]|nr:Acetyl esterase/lipase [Burkholderiales bacterium 8X]
MMIRSPAARLALFVAAAVFTLALAACSPLKLINGLVPGSTYILDEGLAYGSLPRQRLDVYRPLAERAAPEGRRPLVVFFYGGTWSSGDRAGYRFVGEALASQGAIVVLPDYRLAPGAVYPDFVRDSAMAVKWALDNALRLGADPARVYVMGHSSGAYNAAMVALDDRWLRELGADPSRLAGWVGLAGPYDFLPIDNPQAQVAFSWPNTPADSQPLAHASAKAPRTLLVAATKDETVDPRRNTLQLAERLRSLGVPIRVELFDDLNHVTLIGAVAKPLRWLGGPVLPPILSFMGLPGVPSDKVDR